MPTMDLRWCAARKAANPVEKRDSVYRACTRGVFTARDESITNRPARGNKCFEPGRPDRPRIRYSSCCFFFRRDRERETHSLDINIGIIAT